MKYYEVKWEKIYQLEYGKIRTENLQTAKDYFAEKLLEGKKPELFEIEVVETKRKIDGFEYMYYDA